MFDFTVLGVGHLILGTGLTLDVLLNKERPVSAVLWMAVVWAFPYLGALGYLTFGVDRVRRGAQERDAAKALVAQRAALHPRLEEVFGAAAGRAVRAASPADHIFRATDPAVQPNRVVPGNRVRLLVDGDQFYPALFEAIENATSSVHVQTFIIARDHVGTELVDRLIRCARRGVEVRLLYDRFGSMYAHYTGFFDRAREAGVRVYSITQANPLKGRFQVNLRNHRKIAVIDGRLGFVGGINFKDAHTSRYAGSDAIRDYHLQVEGPVVSDLQFQFVQDWYFASRNTPDALLEPVHFPRLESVGDALVQIVPGGPELAGRGLADAFFGAIVAAERSILIATPYFVPDEPIVQALQYAARRGVDVKLVLPRKSNHWYTGFAARSLYESLLWAGVRIFERAPPFMHAKALVVDGVYAMLGSANLDYRSLHLNFETNIEVADERFVETLLGQLNTEIDASREVLYSAHRSRALYHRLIENFCRLFQPML